MRSDNCLVTRNGFMISLLDDVIHRSSISNLSIKLITITTRKLVKNSVSVKNYKANYSAIEW